MNAQVRAREYRSLKTAWIESGPEDRPILLFLHGYPDSAETWQFQLEYFQDRFHILCPYSRGTGPSEASPDLDRYGRTATSLDLLQLLDYVDPKKKKKVILIGHDLGVVHAWKLAPLLGSRLAGLTIINGLNISQMVHRMRIPAQWIRSWYIGLINIPYLSDFIATHFAERIQKLAYDLGELPESLRPESKDSLRTVVAPMNQYRAFLRELPHMLSEKPVPVRCPTLVLWGRKDPFLLAPTLDELEPYTKNVTVRILDGNHWLHRDNASLVNQHMDAFLRTLEIQCDF